MGAYGLAFRGVQFPARFQPPPVSWRPWDLEVEITAYRPDQVWTHDTAVVHMRPEGAVVVDRQHSTSRLLLPTPPSPEAFAHPFLGLSAMVVAGWDEAPNYHAGSFVHGGKAWLIAAESEAGKSSMLAWFATHGVDILADDLSIVRDGCVQAGPRCIDLRQSASEHFGVGEDVGVIGTRRRFRVPLPPVPPEIPVGGWVRPRWGDRIAVLDLPAEERLRTMALMRGWVLLQPDPRTALQLLALPALDFVRPRDWSHLDSAMTALLDRLPG